MPNYLLNNLDSKWSLIRETPYSQKFMVDVADGEGLTATLDIHYTKPEIVYVSVCLVGPKAQFTDGKCAWLFSDLEKIIRKHGNYKVIDYSLVYGDGLSQGNYSIM